ncbi:MAG TPA: SPFH domain-containing protein [Xanthobacteraceae bacterium]
MIGRVIGTVVTTLLYGWIMMAYTPQAALITGQNAARQLDNTDAGYVTAVQTMNVFSAAGTIMTVLFIGVLACIWFKPVRDAIKKTSQALAVLLAAGGALLIGTTDGRAFFEKVDRTEIYPILPNQSAFWIPEIGATKDKQVQVDSEAFLNENKVQLNRFQIPHQKLAGSAGNSVFAGWDYYVPAGRLIIVDRTPFSREWVDAAERGTSVKKEGFPCQSKEGLNVTVGVALGASVSQANAAKYLFRFGVLPPRGEVRGAADTVETDGRVIFTSVYYSRSVQNVMDDFGRKKILELICDQITSRTFDKANEEAKLIKDTAAKQIVDFFAGYGITIDFMGWADTFNFDKDVQDAVNRLYIAKQDEEIGRRLQPYTEVIKALAQAQAQRSFGDKTDGRLPTTFFGMPPEVVGPLLGVPQGVTRTAVPPPAPAR